MVSNEVVAVLGVLTMMTGGGVWLFKKLEESNIKKKFSNLLLVRTNTYIDDAISQCLRDRHNKKLLTDYFYKVSFIHMFISRVMPLLGMIGVLVASVSFVALDDSSDTNFRVKPLGAYGASEYTYNIDGESERMTASLEKGELLYYGYDGKIYAKKFGPGSSLLSVSESGIMVLSASMIWLGIVAVAIVILTLCYFWYVPISEEFDALIEETRDRLGKELKVAEVDLGELPNRDLENQIIENTNALQKKIEEIQRRMKRMAEIK